jgi:hypothetical protein
VGKGKKGGYKNSEYNEMDAVETGIEEWKQ